MTKESDDRVKDNAQKCHQTRKSKNNYVAWNKGLTKDTDSRVAKIPSSNKGRKLSKETIIEAKSKEYITKKLNGTLGNHKSSIEKKLEEKLNSKFGSENIIYNYFNKDVYPFKCDFYIKPLDVYIELNGDPRHGTHPFNENDYEDIIYREELKRKNDCFSNSMLYTWTDLDVRKFECAIKNDLNFIAIYPNKDKDIVYTHWKQCEDIKNILSQLNELW